MEGTKLVRLFLKKITRIIEVLDYLRRTIPSSEIASNVDKLKTILSRGTDDRGNVEQNEVAENVLGVMDLAQKVLRTWGKGDTGKTSCQRQPIFDESLTQGTEEDDEGEFV